MPRYKDSTMQKVYDSMLALAQDKTSELYYQEDRGSSELKGSPRRGAGHRAAFWDGFSGNFTYTGKGRSAHVIPGTPSAACFMAGREFARLSKKAKPMDPGFYEYAKDLADRSERW